MIDGLGIGDVGNVVLRDRQTIATEGIVVIVVPMDQSTGRVTAEPDIITRGFVYMKESGNLIGRTKQIVNQSLKLKKGRSSIGSSSGNTWQIRSGNFYKKKPAESH